MKNVTGRIREKYGLYLIAALVFLAVFLVSNSAPLYGDDFFYKQFTAKNFEYYIQRHTEHYFLANGRVVVHLLATFFLWLPHVFWALFNAFLMALTVFLGAKLSAGENWGRGMSLSRSGLLLAAAVAFLHPGMTRQSVYWLTGSFNYVYPLAMLVIYWYLIDRPVYTRGIKWCIPIFALLAGASTEQAGMMAIGLTVLVLLDRIVLKKQKPDGLLICALVIAGLGAASILLSPSVAYRASIEDAPAKGFLELLKYNIKNQGTTFLFSPIMMPYQLSAMVSALGVLFFNRGKASRNGWKLAETVIMAVGASAFVAWLWQVGSSGSNKDYTIIDPKELLLYLFIGSGYILTLIYASVLLYREQEKGFLLPAAALILCLGSQLMMVVSPVYGPRNLLCASLMLVLYTAAILPALSGAGAITVLSLAACFLFNTPALALVPVLFFLLERGGFELKAVTARGTGLGTAAAFIVLILISGVTYAHTFKGYRDNAVVYEANLKEVEAFKQGGSNGELVQYKIPDDLYAWAMPYHNPYYDPYYKLYIGVNAKTTITWKSSD